MEVRGSVVVVTGASAGIGEATALAFAGHGAAVVAAARREDRLAALVGRIEASGGRALAIRCDVADPSQIEELALRARREVGPVDVVVNNAGIPSGPFLNASRDDVDRVVDVNLRGVLHGTRVFLPEMLERGRGHVVNVASLAGRFAVPGAEVYTATKHAVVAFSEALDHTTRLAGVRVTAVEPAFAPTEAFSARRPPFLTLTPQRIAEEVVRIVRQGIAPELGIPRWVKPFELFRVLTPGPYRWGVGLAVRRYASRAPRGPRTAS